MSIWLTDEETNEIMSLAPDGELSAQQVYETAKNEDSSLHHRFEWDPEVALDKYNLQVARRLIRTVKVNYVGKDGAKKETPAFVNLVTTNEKTGESSQKYYHISVVNADKEKKRQAILAAIRHIKYWQEIKESYDELDGIVHIDESRLEKLEKDFA